MLTISSPNTDRHVLTQAETRVAIGDNGSISSTKIDTLRSRVAAVINRVCHVVTAGATPPTLRLETVAETVRLRKSAELLLLSRRPIASVTSVVEDGPTLAATDYEILAAEGLLRRLSDDEPSTWLVAKIVTTYSAGWQTVPNDLKEAACKLAAVLWSEGERVDPNLRREVEPGIMEREYCVSPASDPLIPAEVMDLLAPYRNHWVG